MNNLEINRKDEGGKIVLNCIGRLDANWAGHLNDYIDGLVREGHYHISLDLKGIEYLSSAGIRSLVTQYKNLKGVNGYFYIDTMSENVNEVLGMVGMVEMLTHVPAGVELEKQTDKQHEQISAHGFSFDYTSLGFKDKSTVRFYGKPELVLKSEFEAIHARMLQSSENNFSLGLGAIGNSYDECKNRFGEYIMLGKNIAYLPADGSKKPDYMISSGKLVASLTELYGIHFKGDFSHLLRFESKGNNGTLQISKLIEEIKKYTNFKRFGLVMVAESGGVVATSLNSSPVDGKKIFSYPEIRDTVNFTTEPAYSKMLTLSVAYISSEPTQIEKDYTRPIQSDSETWGHIHSAVFPYLPLKKTNISLSETIDYLFNNSELSDVLHLTNDVREIVGLGESQFVQGFCWIAPVKSNNTVSPQ